MKKIILILAVVMFSASVALAQIEVSSVAQNKVLAQEDAAQKMHEELMKIEQQINEKLQKGESVEKLEKQRREIEQKLMNQ